MASPHAPGVGLLQAESADLREEGAFIGMFHRGSALCFQGRVQLRVLAGLLHLNGFILKPSPPLYHTLYAPTNESLPVLTVVDPLTMDQDFDRYLKPFRSRFIQFVSSRQRERLSESGLCVDLGQSDVDQLNALMAGGEWQDLAAVVVLKPLENALTRALQASGSNTLVVANQVLKGFRTVLVGSGGLVPLQLPLLYRRLAWDIMAQSSVVVMVCGDVGTGKSTLCRFLINYMLNRYAQVAFLECDVGQTEFTVPGVLSLHSLSSPVFGPPYTHQRTSEKAYYYGDKTPKRDPELYIRTIQSLYAHFQKGLRAKDPHIPLVINTCGWLNDMGVQLFLDIVRTVKPTHIIRLLPPFLQSVDHVRTLPPLTAEFLSTTPGLFTWPEQTSPQPPVKIIEPGYIQAMRPTTSSSLLVSDISDSDVDSGGEPSSSEEMAGGADSSDSSLAVDSSGSGEEKDERREKVRKKRQQKRKQRWLVRAELDHAHRKRLRRGRMVRFPQGEQGKWVTVLSHQICTLTSQTFPNKGSKLMRKLGLISYFSPLVNMAPQHCHSFLQFVPPLEVPWSDVAVHVLHTKVPDSHVLYAMNGRFVALGRVDPTELVQVRPDMMRFVKSRAPLIEFLGLGLLRGVDPGRRVFYLSTPEGGERLSQVNVLVAGNTDHPDFMMAPTQEDSTKKVNWPYYSRTFQPCPLGALTWTE